MVVHAQGLWYRSVCLSVTTLAATFLVHTLQGAIRLLVVILTIDWVDFVENALFNSCGNIC